MKLLFDENLSFKLSARLQDIFPGSEHVRNLGLEQAEDSAIWTLARNENFTIVTKDSDFNDICVIRGYPPYIIWLRSGNSRVNYMEGIIRTHHNNIERSVKEGEFGIIEVSG